MASHYVYSTLTAPQIYLGASGLKVRIEGGANSPTQYMHTPRGVATPINDEQLDALQSCGLFNTHKNSGFVEVSRFEKNADKVAENMSGNDKSRPDTEERLKKEGKDAPKSDKK